MLLLPCPYCGARAETEFRYGGPSHLARPEPFDAVSDAQWADYLFYRTNPKGVSNERWQHVYGCQQWFNIVRDTVSHDILAVYPMGCPAPQSEKLSK